MPRDRHIDIRVTEDEVDLLKWAAAEEGDEMGPWMRKLALQRAKKLKREASAR